MPLDLNIAGNIADLSIQDNTGRRTVAYGSWAAQRILDQTFSVWFNGMSSDRLRNPVSRLSAAHLIRTITLTVHSSITWTTTPS